MRRIRLVKLTTFKELKIGRTFNWRGGTYQKTPDSTYQNDTLNANQIEMGRIIGREFFLDSAEVQIPINTHDTLRQVLKSIFSIPNLLLYWWAIYAFIFVEQGNDTYALICMGVVTIMSVIIPIQDKKK